MKHILLLALVLFSLNVFADDGHDCDNAVCEAVDMTLVPFAITSVYPLVTTVTTDWDHKETADAVKDDAAQYLAEGGQPSALLQSEFDAMRTKYPQARKLSDADLASVIVNSN